MSKFITALSKCIVVAGLVVGLLTTSLCAHGFIVHQLTPLETIQCASEEVNVDSSVKPVSLCDLVISKPGNRR